MHWNQEQGPSLFGFTSDLDKTVFLMIISCSGIGPKLGIAVLSAMSAKDFLAAVQTGNDKAFSAISGIGAKKAEQLIMQLRDKVAKLVKSGVELDETSQAGHWHTVSQALASLNYTCAEVAQTMKYLSQTYSGTSLTFDQLMRYALSYLAKKS
jgi:Holliday junction DNA helicase RuvA